MKKRDKAVAIGYSSEKEAPEVLARGQGEIAEALCAIAKKNGIPVLESKILAEALIQLNPFEYIPEPYWIAIAEILGFVYRTQSKDGFDNPKQ